MTSSKRKKISSKERQDIIKEMDTLLENPLDDAAVTGINWLAVHGFLVQTKYEHYGEGRFVEANRRVQFSGLFFDILVKGYIPGKTGRAKFMWRVSTQYTPSMDGVLRDLSGPSTIQGHDVSLLVALHVKSLQKLAASMGGVLALKRQYDAELEKAKDICSKEALEYYGLQ